MAEVRSVSVHLDADVAGYIAKMRLAGAETDRAFGRSAEQNIGRLNSSLGTTESRLSGVESGARRADGSLRRVESTFSRVGNDRSGLATAAGRLCLLPNLDAAVMVQGDGVFGGHVRALSQTTVGLLQDHSFDGLTREIRPALQDLWRWATESPSSPDSLPDSTVYLVGYSDSASRFTGTLYASDHDFEPEPVEGVHVHPMPLSYRPPQLQLERLRRDFEQVEDPENLEEFVEEWEAQPECPTPVERVDWAELGIQARYSRALREFPKILVGGSLHFTHIERGMALSQRVWDFDDTGEQLLALVGYSQHPAAQTRPCWCGSGKRHLDCHLADQVNEPCGCGSGRLFRDCCMIHEHAQEAAI